MILSAQREVFKQPIGILGGTFDPIHFGHLAIAEFLLKHCPLAQIHFIPCLSPPHRPEPKAGAYDRLRMIQLAIKDCEGFVANDIDFHRPPPSYMVDTLTVLCDQYPKTPLCLILGMDAFASFNRWHEWPRILTLTNLIIVNRSGFKLPEATWCQNLLKKAQVESCQTLSQHLSGKILIQDLPPSSISATEIRQKIHSSQTTDLPSSVLAYIKQHHLYEHSV